MTNHDDPLPGPEPGRRRLESWKEIAAHLRRTVRTVQRWEREQSLPVHRLIHNKLSTVYAYVEELDQWRTSRAVPDEHADDAADDVAMDPPAQPQAIEAFGRQRRRLPIWGIAFGVGAAVVVVAIPLIGHSAILERFTKPESARQVAIGRRAWNERTPGGFERARVAFEQAIAADPGNALAYSGLSDTYALLEAFGVMEKQEALARAKQAAAQALEHGAGLAEAHTSMSIVLWEEGDRSGARKEIDQAIALNPRYPTARHWHALYLQDSGRLPEALREGRVASALDPDAPVIAADVALMLRNAGKLDDSQEMLEALLARYPSYAGVHVELAETYRRKKQYGLALERMRSAVQFGDDRPSTIARLAWLENKNGNRFAAFDAARRLKVDEAQGRPVREDVWIEVLVAAGDLDAAAERIEQAVAARRDWTVRITTDELFEGFRRHPRWPEVRERIVAMADTLPAMKVTPPLDR